MYLAGSFLVEIPLIRVSHGTQDVSLYAHTWRPNKAMLDPSKVYLSPLTSFLQLLVLFMHSGRLIKVSLISRCSRQPWGGIISFMISSFMSMNAQARLTSLLGPSVLPYVNDFIKLSVTLIIYIYRLIISLSYTWCNFKQCYTIWYLFYWMQNLTN